MNRLTDEMLQRFLDGELSAEEERELLRLAADEPEARALLRFEARVRQALEGRAAGARGVPAGFADRVMGAIEARAEASASPASAGRPKDAAAATGVGRRLAGAWEALARPRTVTLRPAYALAACLLLAAAGALALAVSPWDGAGPDGRELAVAEEGAVPGVREVAAARGDTVLVRFVFEAPSATSVAVAGDFTRWEPVSMERRHRNGQVIWTGVLAVPRGEHEYMFVVDGSRWVTDPLATAVSDDGFGNRNAVLSL